MKSKISFYSFKDTENVTARHFRKDQQSNFQLFEMQRLQEKNRQQSVPKRRKNYSHAVLVQSKEEQQLLSFLKGPNLPKVKMVVPKKKTKDKQLMKNTKYIKNSSLDKILQNKPKFMRKYFRGLHEYERTQGIDQVRHIFEAVKLGYLKTVDIIFKATHVSGRERYIKYNYEKYINEIKTNYEEFVKEKMELELILKRERS